MLPTAEKDGQCRWHDPIKAVTMAEGFSDLYDKVLKDDYTPMRKRLTEYLRGPKQYYQYMRLVMGTEYCALLSARLVAAATGPAREKTCKSKFRLTSSAHGVKRTRGQEFCVTRGLSLL